MGFASAIEATSRHEYCRSRRCCRAMLSTRWSGRWAARDYTLLCLPRQRVR